MKPYKTLAHINSLKGEMKEITILEQKDNNYIVDYNGVRCTAIFNWFNCQFYVDDVYVIIKEK